MRLLKAVLAKSNIDCRRAPPEMKEHMWQKRNKQILRMLVVAPVECSTLMACLSRVIV